LVLSSNQDNLCFLSHGGSSETFTVNEGLPVNSIIGTIKVIGNASIEGDIELSLASEQSSSRWPTISDVPIKIAEGTKDLILIKKLDKEGVEGEQSVIIGVKCKKRHSRDQSIIIPIRILITDANDNKPEWIGLPYVVNISEVTAVGSVVMQNIRAIDNDQLGPFSTVEYYVESGPFSHLVRFISQLEGTLILSAPLDYETLPKFWVTIRAQDRGYPPLSATTTVTVNIIDSDDQNPRFVDDKYSATLPDQQRAGEQLVISPRPIKAEDPDKGIRSPIIYSFNSESKENSYFLIDSKFGDVTLKKPLIPALSLPLTLVIRATQVDNRDRYALTTLTILNRRQLVLPDIRFVQSNYSTSLLESTPPGQVVLTVHTSRSLQLNGDKISMSGIEFQILDDEEQHFGVKNTGEVILVKSLDYEKHKYYSFRVMVSDGRQSDVTRITVQVLNVNEHDPVLSQNNYVFHVSESRLRNNSMIGEIHATDTDDGDIIQLSLKGPHSSMFSINSEGRLRVKNLKNLNTTECHLIVMATDSGTPPRSASASVLVHFSPQILKNFGRNIDFDQTLPAIDVNLLSESSFFSPSSSSAIILVIVLGVLLGTLFIIIIALTLHVLKHRKYVSSSGSLHSTYTSSVTHNHNSMSSDNSRRNISSLGSLKNNKVGALPQSTINSSLASIGTRGVENPIFNMPSNRTTTITRIEADSAVVSDASSNETIISTGDRTDLIRNIPSPLSSNSPPPPPNMTGTASRISVIKWPQGSIPRRVKKLTWEDERDHHLDNHYDPHYSSSIAIRPNSVDNNDSNNAVYRQTELDPDVSVIPLRRTLHSSASGLPDLTVYF
ncbi:protocadherin Fat 4-like, partial [Oppia nitens]|uniref:protocadherin Fat 4-like n=1 Tax=Oppia nitens TaxID=1686743 RepID=UPI0023DA0F9B